jgi:hypothetical protein
MALTLLALDFVSVLEVKLKQEHESFSRYLLITALIVVAKAWRPVP